MPTSTQFRELGKALMRAQAAELLNAELEFENENLRNEVAELKAQLEDKAPPKKEEQPGSDEKWFSDYRYYVMGEVLSPSTQFSPELLKKRMDKVGEFSPRSADRAPERMEKLTRSPFNRDECVTTGGDGWELRGQRIYETDQYRFCLRHRGANHNFEIREDRYKFGRMDDTWVRMAAGYFMDAMRAAPRPMPDLPTHALEAMLRKVARTIAA